MIIHCNYCDISSSSVARAYTASLESQLSTLRDELATVYKTQGQNAQRLLVMNEALREREERSRAEVEETRLLRVEAARLRERVASHAEVMREKERNVQVCPKSILITRKKEKPIPIKSEHELFLSRYYKMNCPLFNWSIPNRNRRSKI